MMNELILVGTIKLISFSDDKVVNCLVSTTSPFPSGELHMVQIPSSSAEIVHQNMKNNWLVFFEGENTKQLRRNVISRMEYMAENGYDIVPLIYSKKIREAVPFSVDDIPRIRPEIDEDEDVPF